MRRKQHRQLDPEEVVAAAVAIAFETGLHAVALPVLAERLQVHPRSVEAACPSVADVVGVVFTRIVAAELAEVKRIVLAHPSPISQMNALLDTLAEPVRVEVDSVWLEAWSLGRHNAALAAAVREEEGAWHLLVAAVIRRGVRSGDFLPVEPNLVAAQMLAMISGVNAYSLVGYQSDLDRLELMRSAAGAQLGLAFAGAAASATATLPVG